MSWSVPARQIIEKKVHMKFSDLSKNLARDTICNQLGCAVFLEDVNNQNTAFPKFIGKFGSLVYMGNPYLCTHIDPLHKICHDFKAFLNHKPYLTLAYPY